MSSGEADMLSTTIEMSTSPGPVVFVLVVSGTILLAAGLVSLFFRKFILAISFFGVALVSSYSVSFMTNVDSDTRDMLYSAISQVQDISPGTEVSDEESWIVESAPGQLGQDMTRTEFVLTNGESECKAVAYAHKGVIPGDGSGIVEVEDTEGCRAIVGEVIE